MSFFQMGAEERIGNKNRLRKLNQLLKWEKIQGHLKGYTKMKKSP